MTETAVTTCSWCGHVHEFPEGQPPDFGTCRAMGMLRQSEGAGRCECAGEEAMGVLPAHPKKHEEITECRPLKFFEVCEVVVRDHQASSFKGVLIDAFSAGAVLAVHKALRDDLKPKMIGLVNRAAEKHGPAVAMSAYIWKYVR